MSQSNFEFLKSVDKTMHNTLLSAENYVHSDPNTAMYKIRQFGEFCAKQLAVQLNIEIPENQLSLINALQKSKAIPADLVKALTHIRKCGNSAVHEGADSAKQALQLLHISHHLAFWFYKLDTKQFDLLKPDFITPSIQAQNVLQLELDSLKRELKKANTLSANSKEAVAAKERKVVDLQGYISILESNQSETEQQYKARIKSLELQIETQQLELNQLSITAQKSEVVQFESKLTKNKFELSEQETRFLIDAQLAQAGWLVDSELLHYAKGTRPQIGKNMAIAEWRVGTTQHKADYVLFMGLQPVAVVEAKKKSISVRDALPQAQNYAQGFDFAFYKDQLSASESPNAVAEPKLEYNAESKFDPIHFVYSANGREYLHQVKTQSGIWFSNTDGDNEQVLSGFHSPEDIEAKIALHQSKDRAKAWLKLQSKKELDLFTPSEAAVIACEHQLVEKNNTKQLIAMATGTGKTRVAGAIMYRLLTSGMCKNVLFLVDRRSLGKQASDAFADYKIKDIPLSDHYGLYPLGEKPADKSQSWIQVATVQSLSLMLQSNNNPLTVGMYDCIIVDEAHRGYNEDAEQTEAEMLFRNQAEYQSKYRQVLDYFDAIKIGLTATPATNTVKIFGKPIYNYTFKQAVLDGRLVDQEPPIIIETELSQEGIKFDEGATVEQLVEGEIVEGVLPEELKIDVSGFNRKVLVPEFNRAVCNALPEYIDPTNKEKTLVFCVNDIHAEEVLEMLRETYKEKLGNETEKAIIKITGQSEGGNPKRIEQLISRYRKERLPSIVVTVDLLTTGIDVRPIRNLVFLRQVKSRILYEQMKGRATRTCSDYDKQSFRIFDAVNLIETIERLDASKLMKPVVTRPTISNEDLLKEMASPDTNSQIVADDGTTFAQQSLEALSLKLSRVFNKAAKQKDDKPKVAEQLKQLDDLTKQHIPELNSIVELPKYMLAQGPMAAAQLLQSNPWILTREPTLKEAVNFGEQAPYLYEGEAGKTTITQNWRGYNAPEDYLIAFRDFIQNNQNKISALNVVVNRPRDLTKKDLVQLLTELENHRFDEQTLIQARKVVKQEDVAARIIGLIRRAAIGSPLTPFEERLQTASETIIKKHNLTTEQTKWLNRIVNQMRDDLVLNEDSFKVGNLRRKGGKQQANLDLNGKLDEILKDLVAATWPEQA
ncbi:type I restriction-modification system endonuclease [Paraferrimonas sp. SM1919]|uniref:type I restriction-modification system endonuclease n=1 Tax=Paraferrimonas sp. SM1919 TaxID=2662263 RepID=UPI0013D6BB58|nr:type I restriction-modification system endonuclease [Paraferrimonas sp. SM1919]